MNDQKVKYLSTVTQKGQVTIPLALREKLGIKKYGQVELVLKDHALEVYPVEDITDLVGQYSVKSKKSVLKAREEFEKKYHRF